MKKTILALILALGILLGGCGGEKVPATTAAPEVPFGNYIQPADSFAGGSGTEADPFQIETIQQLALLAEVINRSYDVAHYDEEQLYRYGHYVLIADISLNDAADFDTWQRNPPQYAWEPIGCKDAQGLMHEFRGVFDSQGHTISGLYLPGDVHTGGGGLFGQVSKATIRNVNITDSLLIAAEEENAGLLAAQCLDSTIRNCHVSGQVFLNHVYQGGGVIGDASGKEGFLKDCSFSGNLTAENISGNVGGVCGYISCQAEGLENHGALELKDSPVASAFGGIAGGVTNCTLTGSTNSSSVTVLGEAGSVGGICGQLDVGMEFTRDENGDFTTAGAGAVLSDCINSGSVSASNAKQVGGIVGSGFNCFKSAQSIILRGCENTGTVTGLEKVGGIVGEMYLEYASYQLVDCVNTGTVEGQSRVGGMIGSTGVNKGASAIEGCENRGSVTASDSAAGILGWGADMNLGWDAETDSGCLTITRCHNSGTVTVDSGTAGGILSRLFHPGGDFTMEITKCENTGTVHSTDSGRLGGILGGCTAGYVLRQEGAACYIRSCVNSGTLSYGDATVDAGANHIGSDGALNTTEKALTTMSGSAAGGIVGSSFQTVVENCLNRGQILLATDTSPIRDYRELSSVSGEEPTVFAGSIYGLFMYSPNDEDNSFEKEHITDCAYTGSFDTPVCAPFLLEEPPVISGNRRISEEEAQALTEKLLK